MAIASLFALVACGSSARVLGSASEDATSTPQSPQSPLSTVAPSLNAPTATAAPGSTNPLEEALQTLGVDLDRAPRTATALGQATFCGYEVRSPGRPLPGNLNEVARRCFLDHYSSSRSAIFVESDLTTEGDPIVTIYRWGSDGPLEIYVDATRDSFGSGQWEVLTCAGVTTEFPNAPEPLPAYFFGGDGCGAMTPASA